MAMLSERLDKNDMLTRNEEKDVDNQQCKEE